MNDWKNDPENYQKMSTPFESRKDATSAVTKFHRAVEKLRQKHQIAELACISQVYLTGDDGQLHGFISSSQFGMQAVIATMVAKKSAEMTEDIITKQHLVIEALADRLEEVAND